MYLGIDIGTSSLKCAVLDEAERVVAQSSVPLEVSRPQPGFVEQDPQAWWQATLKAVHALPEAARAAVKSVGLSGQMHGATLLDRRDVPLRPAILWNDGRSAAECRELESREPRSREITGNIVMPGFTAPKLLWVARHEPGIFERTACVLLPKDYVRLKLTGEKISDMSDASGTAWLDVARRDWSDAMLEASRLTRAHMPHLVEGSAPGGTISAAAAAQLRLPRALVAGGGGDNAATAVGMGVVQPGQAFLSLGTSGVLFVVTDRFRPNAERAAHAFCHCLPGRWHQMSVMLSAASALDWAASLVGEPDLQRLVAAAEARGLERRAPYFLPYLSGERTPHNDPHSRGVFFGIGSDTSPADLALAVMEGVAFAFADGLDVLLEQGGSIDEISVSGGGARFAYWGRLLSAALDRPLTYRQGSEISAALGAARLGRMAFEGASAPAHFAPPPIVRAIEPEPALAQLLAERRQLFRRLYQNLVHTFAEHAS